MGNGSFGPQTKLTRGQFIVMLMRAYGMGPTLMPPITMRTRASPIIPGTCGGEAAGISNGVGGNLFARIRKSPTGDVYPSLQCAASDRKPPEAIRQDAGGLHDATEIDPWARRPWC